MTYKGYTFTFEHSPYHHIVRIYRFGDLWGWAPTFERAKWKIDHNMPGGK